MLCLCEAHVVHEWAFVQIASYTFVLPSAAPPHTHTPSHTHPHMHTLTLTQGSHAEWYVGVLLKETKRCQVLQTDLQTGGSQGTVQGKCGRGRGVRLEGVWEGRV